MKRNKKFSLLLLLSSACMMLTVFLAGCSGLPASPDGSGSAADAASGKLTVKVLDVGQGDSILIRTDSQTVMIDTSDKDERDKLEAAIKKESITTVDKLILTHPHADHIGGAAVVLEQCDVKAVYDNGQPSNTKLYRDYLKTVKNKGIPYKALRDGDSLDFGNGATFAVISPTEEMVKEGGTKDGKINLNLNSVAGRLAFGDFTMMFTGDGEKETEAGILQRHKPAELQSLVLKAPHHGSKTSSSAEFLKAVSPEAVLISCGKGNDYGHPHKPVMERYKKQGIAIYRTDTQGTLTVTTDGKTYEITAEKKGQ